MAKTIILSLVEVNRLCHILQKISFESATIVGISATHVRFRTVTTDGLSPYDGTVRRVKWRVSPPMAHSQPKLPSWSEIINNLIFKIYRC